MPSIPAKCTFDYIESGTPEGEGRNNNLIKNACQMRDAGYGPEETLEELTPVADREGLPAKEIERTVRNVYKRPPRPAAGRKLVQGPWQAKEAALEVKPLGEVEPIALPDPITNGHVEHLRSCFEEGELIWIGKGYLPNGQDKYAIEKGEAKTREQWIELFSSVRPDEYNEYGHGLFAKINPMKSAKSGSDDNVAALSHTLIESDQISKDEQFAAWKASGLPISAIVDSGSKSIHAWVRVDAAHKAEYDERVKLVAAYLKGYEIDKTSDPSRYARMAGGMRPEGRQFLLATNIGAATFEEWETTLEYEDGSEDIAIDALLAFDRRNDEKGLAGQRWLAKGGQSVIQGPTGVGKSSLILQWAIRWAIGKGFFGIQPAKAMRVLIIQAENDLGDMAEAFQDTTDAILGFDEETKKISAELAEKKLEMVCHNLVMMRQDSKTGKAFVDFARRMVDKHRPDIVFADPLLAYVGDDILQQRVASEFLRNWMNPMIRETDVHWIWVHHISKPGGQANGREQSAEQVKYSGLGSSELQNACREVITLSELGGGLFSLDFTKRGKRLGLMDAEGNKVTKFNIKHGDDGIYWKNAEGAESTANKAKAKNIAAYQMVKDEIVKRGTITDAELRAWASMTSDIGQNIAIDYAKAWAEDKTCEPRIYRDKREKPIDPKTGKKAKGNSPIVFTTVKPKWLEEYENHQMELEREKACEEMELEFKD